MDLPPARGQSLSPARSRGAVLARGSVTRLRRSSRSSAVTVTGAALAVLLCGSLSPCQASVTHLSLGFNTFTFHWAYTTADLGGPPGDIFRAASSTASRIALSDPGGPVSQRRQRHHPCAVVHRLVRQLHRLHRGRGNRGDHQLRRAHGAEPGTLSLLVLGLAGLGVTKGTRRLKSRVSPRQTAASAAVFSASTSHRSNLFFRRGELACTTCSV